MENIDLETFKVNRGNYYDNREEKLFGYDAKDKNNNYLYESFINIRPSQNNHFMQIQDKKLKKQIKSIVDKLLF